MEMKDQQAYEQAARVLPIRLRQEALSLSPTDRGRAEELRLRCGQPLTAVLPEEERTLGREPVTGRDLEQLLELAKPESADAEKNFCPVDFGRLVQSSLLTFEPVFFERGLAFSAQVDESVTVSGEAEKLSRAVEILLDNAAKYSREGGQVRVSLQRRMKGRCLLTVASQGQGLSPQELKDIFKRFYRADPARSNDGSFGLGLPIAQSIVTRHGGRIWAESRDGVNSFYIELPCA